jgi:hypothetical protein
MNRNILKHGWYVIQNELNERWPALTQSDLKYIFADRDKLIAVVQKRTHVSQEKAARDVTEFLDHLKLRTSIA